MDPVPPRAARKTAPAQMVPIKRSHGSLASNEVNRGQMGTTNAHGEESISPRVAGLKLCGTSEDQTLKQMMR